MQFWRLALPNQERRNASQPVAPQVNRTLTPLVQRSQQGSSRSLLILNGVSRRIEYKGPCGTAWTGSYEIDSDRPRAGRLNEAERPT
jgi:hypothetical protein